MSLFKKKEREPIPIIDLEIKLLLETVFLPEWNTTAQLCEDGTIYIMFIVGRYHSKSDLMKDERIHIYYTNEELLQLFYQLEKYRNIKYEVTNQ